MTTAGNQDHAAETFALQMRPGVAKHLSAVVPKVTHFLKKALTAGQSFDMNKLMNDINMAMGFDRSDTGRIEKYVTEDKTADALNNRIAATISTPLNYRELFGRNKIFQRDDLDQIINDISASMAEFYMDKFYLAGITTADKTTADFQTEADTVFGKTLIDLHEQYSTPCYYQCFCHLLATLSSLVGVQILEPAMFEGLRDLKPYLTKTNEDTTA